MMIICSDDFTGDNTANFSGRTLNNALGGTETATWAMAHSGWDISSNKATSGGFASTMLVAAPTANGIRASIRTAASNNRSSLVANIASSGNGPAVIAYLSSDNDAIVLRQMNVDDIYGTDVASTPVSISNSTDYVMTLSKAGSAYEAKVYQPDGVTLIGSVAYDFGGTTFSGQYWGVSAYTGEWIYADDVIIYAPDAPPSGNALLLQLMQHGHLNGGLL